MLVSAPVIQGGHGVKAALRLPSCHWGGVMSVPHLNRSETFITASRLASGSRWTAMLCLAVGFSLWLGSGRASVPSEGLPGLRPWLGGCDVCARWSPRRSLVDGAERMGSGSEPPNQGELRLSSRSPARPSPSSSIDSLCNGEPTTIATIDIA